MVIKNQIPVLGRARHAVSMKYQVDNIMTRLYVVQENQFQIVDKTKVPSLKRAFRDCSVYSPEELADLAYAEIKMAIGYTFDNFDISTRVERIEKNDYRLEIFGTITSNDGKETYPINEMLSFNGSSFTRLTNSINGGVE